MPIDLNTCVSRTADLLSTEVDEDIIILNVQTNNYIALDEIGHRIWDLLESPIRVVELCQQLKREFSGEQDQIQADVLAFLEELEAEHMLVIST